MQDKAFELKIYLKPASVNIFDPFYGSSPLVNQT